MFTGLLLVLKSNKYINNRSLNKQGHFVLDDAQNYEDNRINNRVISVKLRISNAIAMKTDLKIF